MLQQVFPGTDILSVGGFLQLLFFQFGLILAGLAAATLVGTWASDETSGRLEMLLATPLARARWVVSGGIAIVGETLWETMEYVAFRLGQRGMGLTYEDTMDDIIGTWIGAVAGAAFILTRPATRQATGRRRGWRALLGA